MPERTAIRVVVLDGLDWEWCSQHRDLCPALWQLAEEGCAAPLRSCAAPITPAGVGTLLSGREITLDWVRREGIGGDFYASSADLIRTRPWFSALAQEGLTVGLANVPITWPAFRVPKGSWLVSGFPVDKSTLTDETRPWKWPRGLDTLGYPIEGIVCDTGPGGTRDLRRLVDTESEVVSWVLKTAPRADLEIVWLRSTDGAGHHLWGTPAYGEVVQAVTEQLRRLREGCETLIVISDHGMDSLSSPRCGPYMSTTHGPTAQAAGLTGGHAMEGVLVAAGPHIHARGLLPEQRLSEVAGGLFDLLQIPPPVGMLSVGPAWAVPYGPAEAERIAADLARLGYST